LHPQAVAPRTTLLTRAFHPMFALYAGVLAGVAVVFDLLYLMVGGGVLMAALYTLPITAGLVACLVAAADELDLDRPAVRATAALAAAAGLTNALYLAAINTIRATTPTTWTTGALAVLLSGAAVLAAAVTIRQLLHLAALATPTPPDVPPPAAPAVSWTPAPPATYVERVNPSLAALVDQTLIDHHAPDQTVVDPVVQTLVLAPDHRVAA
jgi:hypothetical protein